MRGDMGPIHLPFILEKTTCQISWVLNASTTIVLMPNETSKQSCDPSIPGKIFNDSSVIMK